jgi:hypothetical protein
MKAFFLVIFLLNEDNTHNMYHVGRLPGCGYANAVVNTYIKRHKIDNDKYAGYLCLSSRHYGDNKIPKFKQKNEID